MDPTVIMNGSKIILIEVGNVKFIDSLHYFHMPLSSLSTAYGLTEIEKGVFLIYLIILKIRRMRMLSHHWTFTRQTACSVKKENDFWNGIPNNQQRVTFKTFKPKL